jgi:protease-4
MKATRGGFVPFLLGGLVLGVGSAHAQPLPPRAEKIFSPGRNTASEETAEAVTLNPANLGYLPASELRWTGVRCPDTAKVGCGHAFTLAFPLPFDIGAGLRVDHVMPPGSNDYPRFPFNGRDYTWVTFAFGSALSKSLAFGGSIQRTYSSNSYTNDIWGVTAGLSLRPNTHFGFAAVAHDFNVSQSPLVPLSPYPVYDRSYVLSGAFRPTGRRAVEIGLDLRYLAGSDQWVPRGMLQVDVPYVGRARADLEVAHLPSDDRRAVLATAGLEVMLPGLTAGGGAMFGNGLGDSDSWGQFATASIRGFREPGLPRPGRAVSIRIESTPGVRKHVALLKRLWAIADDKEIDGVALILRAEPASSFAHAEELADTLRVLRARGKKTLCTFEDNGARSLYVCANADRIVVNPAGGLRYAGLRSQYFYLAGLLSKLGVKAEFVRIGAHKTAPEQFTNEAASDVARADHMDTLRNVEAVFVKNVAAGRRLTPEQVRAATATGPFIAEEARAAGFVDTLAFEDETDRVMSELVGKRVSLQKYEPEDRANDTFGPRGRIAILYVDGDMVDGRSSRIPLIDMKLTGSYSIAEQVQRLRDDPSVRAVVLRVETPGGSSMAADVMWRELSLLAKRKPLIVSMGSIAASGGYYIASAGHTIFAEPLTITGSIGIFYGKADISGLLGRIGVNVETYKTAPRADAESFYRGFTPDERQELARKVQQFYAFFVKRVAEGRKMTPEQVDAVGQGRVWTGQQALAHKLVDRLGGLREALELARREADLPYDAPIAEYPPVQKTLLDRALQLAGVERAGALVSVETLPPQLRDVARAVAPMAVFSGDVPLARMEWVPSDALVGREGEGDE